MSVFDYDHGARRDWTPADDVTLRAVIELTRDDIDLFWDLTVELHRSRMSILTRMLRRAGIDYPEMSMGHFARLWREAESYDARERRGKEKA